MLKRILKMGFLTFMGLLVFIIGLNFYIATATKATIYSDAELVPKAYTALVLGARVYKDGQLSGVLKDRIDSALDLYKSQKIARFLLSGDHGRKDYDEVNHMKAYLIEKGVPTAAIFLDHAGFDTYNSLYRAKKYLK